MFVKFHEICFKDKMFEDINDEFSNSNSYRNSEIVVGASPSTYDLKIQNIVSTLLQKTIFSEVKKNYSRKKNSDEYIQWDGIENYDNIPHLKKAII